MGFQGVTRIVIWLIIKAKLLKTDFEDILANLMSIDLNYVISQLAFVFKYNL